MLPFTHPLLCFPNLSLVLWEGTGIYFHHVSDQPVDTLPLHLFPLWTCGNDMWHKLHLPALFHGVPTSFPSHLGTNVIFCDLLAFFQPCPSLLMYYCLCSDEAKFWGFLLSTLCMSHSFRWSYQVIPDYFPLLGCVVIIYTLATSTFWQFNPSAGSGWKFVPPAFSPGISNQVAALREWSIFPWCFWSAHRTGRKSFIFMIFLSAKKNIPFYNVLLWLKNYLLRSHSQYLSHRTSISSHFRTFKEESRKEKPGAGIQLLLQLLATRADCFDPSCDEMSLSSSAQQLVPGRRQLGWRHPRGPGAVCEVVADCDVPPCDGLWHATLALLWLLGTYTNVPQRRAHLFLKEEIHSKSH